MKTLFALLLSTLVMVSSASAGNKKNTAETQASTSNTQTSIRHLKLRAKTVTPPPNYTIAN